jgi:hypothetical protein
MLPRAKKFMILVIVVMVSFACGKSTPKSTSTPAIDTAGTAAAQVAADKATADAQAALDAKATTDAKAALDAKATTDAKAALDAKATADAKATLDAQAALDAKATADAQATLDAKATQSAGATATQAAAQQATQTAVAAQATQTAEALLSVINDELTKVGMSTETGKLGWMQSGSYAIKMDTSGQAFFHAFAENVVASDFVLKSEVTWEASGGMMICGFFFRSEANIATGDQYLLRYLRLSGAPAWDIISIKSGAIFSRVTGGNQPRYASVIKMDNGAMNKWVIIAEGNRFTVYINDQRIGSYIDDSKVRSDGKFAYYGTEEAGTSSCTFNNTWVWLLK